LAVLAAYGYVGLRACHLTLANHRREDIYQRIRRPDREIAEIDARNQANKTNENPAGNPKKNNRQVIRDLPKAEVGVS
jgi:hypothetical protein